MKTKEDVHEYREKRDRNNVAVRKSREKSRLKRDATLERVGQLRTENEQLERRVKLLNDEMAELQKLLGKSVNKDHIYSRSNPCDKFT